MSPEGVLTVVGPLTQGQADALQAEWEKFAADDPDDGTYTVAGVEVTYRRLERAEPVIAEWQERAEKAEAECGRLREQLNALTRAAKRVVDEREGHELGGESPLYVALVALDEAIARAALGVIREQEQA